MRQQLSDLSVSYSFLVQDEPLKTKFETALTEAIDDVLSAFGNTNKQAVYRHLENRCGLKKEAIPFKIEDFANAIEQIFGSNAKLIEIKILERLHAKYRDFSYVPKKGELNFVEFVYNLQHHLGLKA